MTWMRSRSVTTSPGESKELDLMKKRIEIPKFKSESQEADWWASRAGRDYVETPVGRCTIKTR